MAAAELVYAELEDRDGWACMCDGHDRRVNGRVRRRHDRGCPVRGPGGELPARWPMRVEPVPVLAPATVTPDVTLEPASADCYGEPGCGRPVYALSLCRRHYTRQKVRQSAPPRYGCTGEPDCPRPIDSKGLCSLHYGRLLRTGTTLPRVR